MAVDRAGRRLGAADEVNPLRRCPARPESPAHLRRRAQRGPRSRGGAAALDLVQAVRTQPGADPPTSQGRSADADRAAVGAAREAILAGQPAAHGLLPMAELLGISPFRLSRAFTREMGVSLTRYRNRVRVARALDRRDLAALAADLGFADQAHMARTIRQYLGHTPAALRRLLTAGQQA